MIASVARGGASCAGGGGSPAAGAAMEDLLRANKVLSKALAEEKRQTEELRAGQAKLKAANTALGRQVAQLAMLLGHTGAAERFAAGVLDEEQGEIAAS